MWDWDLLAAQILQRLPDAVMQFIWNVQNRNQCIFKTLSCCVVRFVPPTKQLFKLTECATQADAIFGAFVPIWSSPLRTQIWNYYFLFILCVESSSDTATKPHPLAIEYEESSANSLCQRPEATRSTYFAALFLCFVCLVSGSWSIQFSPQLLCRSHLHVSTTSALRFSKIGES